MSNAEHQNPTFELRHRLALALEVEGVKVGEMAEYLEVAPTTMSNYLSGRTRPKAAAIRAWAMRCGVPYRWLATGVSDLGGPSDVPKGDDARTRRLRAA